MRDAGDRLVDRGTLVWALALGVLVFLAFRVTGSFAFLNYDDDVYVTANPIVKGGVTAEGVRRAFTEPWASNWHPLTWLSHMLDVELFELAPRGHHLVNAGLHAATAVLLACALVALAGDRGARVPALLAAAFFALHPLRAESVAWIAERKDLLAGLFFTTTLLAHARFARRPSVARAALVLASFALGLLSKPMLVTLPFVLLLVDRWPLARAESRRRLLLEKTPLFLLAGASCWVTLWAQERGGALDALVHLGLGARMAGAFAALSAYVGDTLWPSGLAVFYPHPALFAGHVAWSAGAFGGLALVLLGTAGALLLRRSAPAVLVGWLWTLGTLVPVSGLVQVGSQSHADRYTYLPTIGLAVALAFGVDALTRGRARARLVACVLGCLWIAALVPLLRAQLQTWRDTRTLMEHALRVTERNYVAHANLAHDHLQRGELDPALEHYRAAAASLPGSTLVQYQLGSVLLRLGRLADASAAFAAALENEEPRLGTQPEWHAARVALGTTLSRRGLDREAEPLLRSAWTSAATPTRERLAAGQALAWLLATSPQGDLRDGAEAFAIAELCASAAPTPGARETLAAACAETGRWNLALRWQGEAIDALPEAHRAAPLERLELYRSGRPYRKVPEEW